MNSSIEARWTATDQEQRNCTEGVLTEENVLLRRQN